MANLLCPFLILLPSHCSTEIIARRLNSDNTFSPSPASQPSLSQPCPELCYWIFSTDWSLTPRLCYQGSPAQPSPAGVIGSDLRSWEPSQLLPDRWPAPLYWAAGQRRGGVQGWCWPVVCQCTHPASRCGLLGWAGLGCRGWCGLCPLPAPQPSPLPPASQPAHCHRLGGTLLVSWLSGTHYLKE